MFPQNQNNDDDPRFEYGQDLQQQVTDYSHVQKHPYTNKIFCWIQQGDTKQVINFFNTFPHLLNEFKTPNNWNPFMYAVRYGNIELIEYFAEKNMKIYVNSIFSHVSMIHAGVFSGDIKILRMVLNDMKCSPNPANSDISPLKIAMKIGNAKMVELLICKGAYYVFGDVFNNIEPKAQNSSEESSKYSSLVTGKDVMGNAVVQDTTIKDCAIKETLRWARIRQIMFLRHCSTLRTEGGMKAEEEEGLGGGKKFEAMSKIVGNEDHFGLILKMCIGGGDSILKSAQVSEQPKEKDDMRASRENRRQ